MSSAADNILDSLEDNELESWGLVIYRCTYTSEEKWERFIATLREMVQDEVAADTEVAEALVWTIEEDSETLDGASMLDVTRRFAKWVAVEGIQEISEEEREDREEGDDPPRYPRYNFFIYVDEAMLNDVVVNWEGLPKKYLTLISAAVAEELLSIRAEHEQSLRDEGLADIIEQDRRELTERFRKRVTVEEFVGVYEYLLDIENWEHFILLPSGLSEF